jgi:hypothetical protein
MTSKLKEKSQAKATDDRFALDERFKAGPSRARRRDDETDSEHGDEEVDGKSEEVEFGGSSGDDQNEIPEGDEGENLDEDENFNANEQSEMSDNGGDHDTNDEDELAAGMNPSGFAGPSSPKDKSKIVKPLTPEALAAFKAKQERTGVIYISRIPPGMRPTKVRHLMSAYGEIGRVYLQQEGMYFISIVTSSFPD